MCCKCYNYYKIIAFAAHHVIDFRPNIIYLIIFYFQFNEGLRLLQHDTTITIDKDYIRLLSSKSRQLVEPVFTKMQEF